ncbi:hypothetical protein ACOME3_003815 [Neoechinorhynchus agilis]
MIETSKKLEISNSEHSKDYCYQACQTNITNCSSYGLHPWKEPVFGSSKVVVGICAMEKKVISKPMEEILIRLTNFQNLELLVFPEPLILWLPVEMWPKCTCFISFYSSGFPLEKARDYIRMNKPLVINDVDIQFNMLSRKTIFEMLEKSNIPHPRYIVSHREKPVVMTDDNIEIDGKILSKPFVEKPISSEDHNIYVYFQSSIGGGCQRLFRKIGCRSSCFSEISTMRTDGSYIYEEFMPTDGIDVKVYTVGPDYAHAEARKSPALDGRVERDPYGKEVRHPIILRSYEKNIARLISLTFKQTVCGFDLLRTRGKSYVCDVNGFSFVKNSTKYYDDCAVILGNMMLRPFVPRPQILLSIGSQLDDHAMVATTLGTVMELRCVISVVRHSDRTPKQKMKMEISHPLLVDMYTKLGGTDKIGSEVKIKEPSVLQELLDIARTLLQHLRDGNPNPPQEKEAKLVQLKSVLEMYGHFCGITRKVQIKRVALKNDISTESVESSPDTSELKTGLLLVLKWGGEITQGGRELATDLGKAFRRMYPSGAAGKRAGQTDIGERITFEPNDETPSEVNITEPGKAMGSVPPNSSDFGLLRLHSTYRHDLKIYASDEGRVQMTAAAFAKGLLALEGSIAPILVQMVKSANTNGLLDDDVNSQRISESIKQKLTKLLSVDRVLTDEDIQMIVPTKQQGLMERLKSLENPLKVCKEIHQCVQEMINLIRHKITDSTVYRQSLYHGESWELVLRRWAKLEKDFYDKNKDRFDFSKVAVIYDNIRYDCAHNQKIIQFPKADTLLKLSRLLSGIIVPQEYGLTREDKLAIARGIISPLLNKIRMDLRRVVESEEEYERDEVYISGSDDKKEDSSQDEVTNRLDLRKLTMEERSTRGIQTPSRHVRTRLYFTSESHVYSLVNILVHGDLFKDSDERVQQVIDQVGNSPELGFLTQIVIMLFEDPEPTTPDDRFHVLSVDPF